MAKRNNQAYLLTGLAVAVAAVLVLTYLYFRVGARDQLWGNLFAEALMLIIAPVVWYYLFGRRGISLGSMQSEIAAGNVITFYPEHSEVDWTTIIDGAKTIDIVVHYYGRWIRANDKAFIRFFERGGQLRIVMADPKMPRVLNAVQKQFFPNLTPSQLSEKIIDTETRASETFQRAGSMKARLTTFYFPQALHYSFILVNDRTLYLSVYEQFRSANVRSSVFGIDLNKDQRLETYWLENRTSFFNNSRVGMDM